MHVPYYYHLESAQIRPQYLITSCPQQSTPLHLQPCLHVEESPALPEVVEDIHKPKLHQKIINLMTARVLGLSNVGVDPLTIWYRGPVSVSGPPAIPVSAPGWKEGGMH